MLQMVNTDRSTLNRKVLDKTKLKIHSLQFIDVKIKGWPTSKNETAPTREIHI